MVRPELKPQQRVNLERGISLQSSNVQPFCMGLCKRFRLLDELCKEQIFCPPLCSYSNALWGGTKPGFWSRAGYMGSW